MPSLLPGHYAAVKVRKELYVTWTSNRALPAWLTCISLAASPIGIQHSFLGQTPPLGGTGRIVAGMSYPLDVFSQACLLVWGWYRKSEAIKRTSLCHCRGRGGAPSWRRPTLPALRPRRPSASRPASHPSTRPPSQAGKEKARTLTSRSGYRRVTRKAAN